jgi:hypothetical protein
MFLLLIEWQSGTTPLYNKDPLQGDALPPWAQKPWAQKTKHIQEQNDLYRAFTKWLKKSN